MIALLQKSTRKDRRYMVQLQTPGKHTIHFGSPFYENYTIHKDPKRRDLYLARHKKGENWEDPTTPAFWSRHLLWEEPSMGDAIKALERRGITVRISRHI